MIQAFYLSFNGLTIDFFKSIWSDSKIFVFMPTDSE